MVSVIIPVFNVKDYLEECLDSICSQTYKDLQILVVDDGSTDGSESICDKYSKADQRITVIHQKNAGLSSARNVALSMVRGDYVMFVDSDDHVKANYVNNLLSLIQKEKDADIGICRYYDESKGEDGKYYAIESISKMEKECLEGKEVIGKRFGNLKVYYVVVWNKIFRKQLFENVRFPEGQSCEDAWVSLELYEKCRKVVCTDEVLYYYRNRENAISKDKSEKWIVSQMRWLEHEMQYFIKNEMNLSLPAKPYFSFSFKNRKQFSPKEKINSVYYCKIAFGSLMKDKNVTFIEKMKYIFYFIML